MLTFLQFIKEHVISVGYNPKHEKHREIHRDEIHNILHKSYAKIGGYSGLGSGSDEEHKSIHHDISHQDMKIVKKDGKAVAVTIYKKSHGRKAIALGHNGTKEGSEGITKITGEDHAQKRAWAETSGKASAFFKKLGHPPIPTDTVKHKLLPDKKITKTGEHTYKREIGGHEHEKEALGHHK